MTRFGHAMEKIDERIPGVDLPLMSVSQTRGVIRRSELTDAPQRAESLDNYKVCRANDIVFNKMSIRSGAMGVAAEDGLVTYHYEVMRPREGTDPHFVAYLMKSSWFTEELIKRERGIGAGNQANVRTTEVPFSVLKTIDAYIPDRAEQRSIADYLDRETVRIDTLIEEQQRLIEMLRERRRAVVKNAIPPKPSLGSGSDKLGRTARIGNGSTPRRENRVYWDCGDVPWLNSSVVNQARVGSAAEFVTAAALAECHLPIVPPGSVLVGLTGQGKTRGMATILDIESTVNQHLAYVTPDRTRWWPDYLLWLLTAAYDDLRRISEENGSTKGGLTCEALKQLRVTVPPIDEQRRIALHLDGQTSKTDTLIAETERFIDLARERRSALITAAVTGQIDVRKAA
ncbi:restriction endonuclease subunit S [Streptomyces rubrogriseus]|uniref:restriction endonuclease subunit S n=1 Tax=Streptomyces rubrogriseus TaxID=194673 RepID=UPI003655C2FF